MTNKEIEKQKEAIEIYNDAMKKCLETYQKLLDLGVSKEQARIILPLSQYTTVIWTCSLEAVMNFIRLRDHDHAQVEIREYAKILKCYVELNFPTMAEIWEK